MKNRLPLTLLALFGLASCSNPTQGMYYSIEKEQKTEDASSVLPNTLEVTGMTVFDDSLWVSAKRLYKKSGSEWTKEPDPEVGGNGYPEILDVASTSSHLFVIASSKSGTVKILSKGVGDTEFTQISSPAAGTPSSLESIQGDDSRVILNVYLSAGSYQTHSLQSTGVSAPLLPTAETHSSPVVQGALSAGNYYLVNRSRLYSGNSLTAELTQEAFSSSDVSLGNIGGLVVTSLFTDGVTDQIILSSSKGKLFARNSANSWTAVVSNSLTAFNDKEKSLSLGRIFEYDRGAGNTPQTVLLVGTDKNGYAEAYRADDANEVDHPTLTSDDSFSTSTAADVTFTSFAVYDGRLYAGTLGGLWKRSSSGTWDYE